MIFGTVQKNNVSVTWTVFFLALPLVNSPFLEWQILILHWNYTTKT